VLTSPKKPEVVFCDKVTSPAGQGGAAGSSLAPGGEAGATGHDGAASSLACRLWTEGPAAIELSAAGYTTIERDLRLDAEQCTTEFELELMVKPSPLP
jgi:hypothetical protein